MCRHVAEGIGKYMAAVQKPINSYGKVPAYQGSKKEQLQKIEKQGFIACVSSIAGLPASLIGFGLILGVVGLILGIKAKRPDGTRPWGAVVAIVAGILSIIIGIPGMILAYDYIHFQFTGENLEFIAKIVQTLSGN